MCDSRTQTYVLWLAPGTRTRGALQLARIRHLERALTAAGDCDLIAFLSEL